MQKKPWCGKCPHVTEGSNFHLRNGNNFTGQFQRILQVPTLYVLLFVSVAVKSKLVGHETLLDTKWPSTW